MDAHTVRTLFQRYVDHSISDPDLAYGTYHDDAVLEFPQSGERFEGVANFRPWRSAYPAQARFELDGVRGREDFWVVEVRISYDGGPWNHGLAILQFDDGRVIHETVYGGEAWEAPEWRARWRAAPPG